MNTYILLNKDKKLIEFEEPDALGTYNIIWHDESLQSIMPPIFTEEVNSDNLNIFIENRTVPVNRHHMEIVVGKLNLQTKFDMLRYCKGLSLTDTFWVKPSYEKVTWEDVNLYTNNFDMALGWMAFTGVPSDVSRDLATPELTTVGVLPKYWDRDKSKVFLVKGGTYGYGNAGLEPISEVCASVVAKVLGLNAIDYKYHIAKNGKPTSVCRLFTTEDVGLLTAKEFRQLAGLGHVPITIKRYMELMEKYDLNITPLKRMIFFDDLVRNPDRHLNNWGFSVDNNTRELIGFAPIWDTGESLIAKTMKGDFPDFATSEEIFSSFGIRYSGLRPIFYGDKEKKDLTNIKKLIENGRLFEMFKARDIPDEEDEKLDLVCTILESRANMILKGLEDTFTYSNNF
ncbi:MAG: hypothetical protein FWF57_00590 [Defluviitaleaceae bacterium]|nr:hypothetical protein [Defluviitaleaceae bacterium]